MSPRLQELARHYPCAPPVLQPPPPLLLVVRLIDSRRVCSTHGDHACALAHATALAGAGRQAKMAVGPGQ
jgi:hypothetical protein